jgi:glutamate synthase (ferredoxin)
MSGGVAYVLDPNGEFPGRCNQEMVDLLPLDNAQEAKEVQDMVWRHAYHTGSRLAWRLLSSWEETVRHFVKVLPRDYGRMLNAIEQARKEGLPHDAAVMAAFQANKQGSKT